MEIAEFIDHVQASGDALASSAASAGLEATVPSCPDWTVRDLVNHTSMVHDWASKIVSGGIERLDGEREPQTPYVAPPDSRVLDAFSESHARLVESLRRAPGDLDCWTFLPAPSALAFWARRQAHETTIHAADAALAAGDPPVCDAALASDGIDELLFGFFARRRSNDGDEFVAALGATDTGSRWNIRVSPSGVSACDERPDVVVTASTSQLYLLVWNRVLDLRTLDVTGQAELLNAWRGSRRVTWS
jgi:uncharacterized protein (TIGR03083 family)